MTSTPYFSTFLSKLAALDENNEFSQYLPSQEALLKMEEKTKEDRKQALELIKNNGAYFDLYKKIVIFLEKITLDTSLIDYQKTIAEQANISDNELLALYKFSLEFYEKQNFDSAIQIAGLLSFLNPEISAFWRMQGASFCQQGDFNTALIVYLNASMINSLEISNHLACLECLFRLGFSEAAFNYYNTAKEVLTMGDHLQDLAILDEFFEKNIR